MTSACAGRQADETTTFQYVTFEVTTGDNPDGDLYIETTYRDSSDIPSDYSNFDIHEPIDSSTESVRLENWEVDGYLACLEMNDMAADFRIEECG